VYQTLSPGGAFTDLTSVRIDSQSHVFDNIVLRPVRYTPTAPLDPPLAQTGIAGMDTLAVSPDGLTLYGVNAAQDALVVVNAADLTQRQLLKDGLDAVDGLDGAGAVVASSGSVYVASTGDRAIAVF
jgi:hypothetical protein